MTNIVSALTARTQLGQIIKRATEKNERFVVDRRGLPSVVIMSMRDYVDTVAPAPKELKAMQSTARRTGISRLTPSQISRIIDSARAGEEKAAKRRNR